MNSVCFGSEYNILVGEIPQISLFAWMEESIRSFSFSRLNEMNHLWPALQAASVKRTKHSAFVVEILKYYINNNEL